jgi:hypothetical protein
MKKVTVSIMVVILLLVSASLAFANPPESKNFVAPLSGAEEVPVRETNARGNTVLHLGSDGTLSYKLIVANIENAFAAHIHCGPAGINGPVGVTLYANPGALGRMNGIIAQGVISAPDPGNACAWESVSDVVNAIYSGNAYVNVHTNDGIDPPNTGPGDFPGGEIRGQIREAGPTN